MWALLFCFLAIGILVWFRYQVQRLVQAAVILIGGSQRAGVLVYTWLFFPGILLHELTHFLTAALLGVRTGEIQLLPKSLEPAGNRIALGSVKVAKTDFFRESLIGAAPFISGCLVMFLIVRVFFWPLNDLLVELMKTPSSLLHSFKLTELLAIYFIWTVANTMFLSTEDTRSFPGIAILAVLVLGLLYLTESLSRAGNFIWPYMQTLASLFAWVFAFVIGVDSLLAALLFIWVRLLQKVTGKRVVFSGK